MKISKNPIPFLGILLSLIIATNVHAQQHSFSGKVLDRQTGHPVIGAHVYWEEAETGTVTDGHGIFRLQPRNNQPITLRITYVGYTPKKIHITHKSSSDKPKIILLEQESLSLSPVTILARKEADQPSQDLDIGSTVNVSHDAGAFLKGGLNISGIRKGGSFGVDPIVRGFKKNQLIVQVDGVLQSQGACPNRMDPPTSHIQMEQVDEVEILKGPYALKHGPSFGGVLNFKSESTWYESDSPWNGYLTTGYESNIGRQRYAGGIEKSGGRWTTNLYGSYISAGDYEDGSGTKVSAGVSNLEFTVDSKVHLNETNSISTRFSQGYVRDADYPALMMDMRKDNTSNLSLTYLNSNLASGRLETSVFSSYVDHLMDNLDREMAEMTEAVTDVTTTTYGYGVTYVLPSSYGNWTFGTDATLRSLEGSRTRDFMMGTMAGQTVKDNVWQGGTLNRWGTVAEYQPSVNEWNIVLAGRMDYYHSDATDPDPGFARDVSSQESNRLTWSVSSGFRKPLSSNWSAGLWLGRAERHAGLDELFINYLPVGLDPYEYIGNPQLKTEINHQADASITFSNKHITIKTTLFYSYIHNYISAKIRPDLSPKQRGAAGVKQFVNIDKAALYGFEWLFSNTSRSRFGYELSSAWTIGRDITRHDDLPQIPALEGNLKLDYSVDGGKLITLLHLRGVAEQKRVAETFGETATDGYLLTDIKLITRIASTLRLSAGINNLFDVTYHEHLNRSLQGSALPLNDPGRSFFVELKWEGALSGL